MPGRAGPLDTTPQADRPTVPATKIKEIKLRLMSCPSNAREALRGSQLRDLLLLELERQHLALVCADVSELVAVPDDHKIRVDHAKRRVCLIGARAIRVHAVRRVCAMQDLAVAVDRIASDEAAVSVGGEAANERDGQDGILDQLAFAAVPEAANPIRIGTILKVQLL